MLAAAALAFLIISLAARQSAGQLRSAGWLLSATASGPLVNISKFVPAFATIRPVSLFGALPRLLLVAAVELISILLQIRAMEQVMGERIDFEENCAYRAPPI